MRRKRRLPPRFVRRLQSNKAKRRLYEEDRGIRRLRIAQQAIWHMGRRHLRARLAARIVYRIANDRPACD